MSVINSAVFAHAQLIQYSISVWIHIHYYTGTAIFGFLFWVLAPDTFSGAVGGWVVGGNDNDVCFFIYGAGKCEMLYQTKNNVLDNMCHRSPNYFLRLP